MLDAAEKLQSIEGTLKDLLLKLGVTEAQHIVTDRRSGGGTQERAKALLKLALKSLTELDSDGAALSMEPSCGTPELDEAAAALIGFGNSRRAGYR